MCNTVKPKAPVLLMPFAHFCTRPFITAWYSAGLSPDRVESRAGRGEAVDAVAARGST